MDPLLQVDGAIAALERGPELPDRDLVAFALERARDQAIRAVAQPFGLSDASIGTDEFYWSLVQSALAGDAEPGEGLCQRSARDVIGFQRYQQLDPGWLACLWYRLTSERVAFPNHVDARASGFLSLGDLQEAAQQTLVVSVKVWKSSGIINPCVIPC